MDLADMIRRSSISAWSREIYAKIADAQREAIGSDRESVLRIVISEMILAGETPAAMTLATTTFDNGMTVPVGRDDGAFSKPSVQAALAVVLAASSAEIDNLLHRCDDRLLALNVELPALVEESVSDAWKKG